MRFGLRSVLALYVAGVCIANRDMAISQDIYSRFKIEIEATKVAANLYGSRNLIQDHHEPARYDKSSNTIYVNTYSILDSKYAEKIGTLDTAKDFISGLFVGANNLLSEYYANCALPEARIQLDYLGVLDTINMHHRSQGYINSSIMLKVLDKLYSPSGLLVYFTGYKNTSPDLNEDWSKSDSLFLIGVPKDRQAFGLATLGGNFAMVNYVEGDNLADITEGQISSNNVMLLLHEILHMLGAANLDDVQRPVFIHTPFGSAQIAESKISVPNIMSSFMAASTTSLLHESAVQIRSGLISKYPLLEEMIHKNSAFRNVTKSAEPDNK